MNKKFSRKTKICLVAVCAVLLAAGCFVAVKVLSPKMSAKWIIEGTQELEPTFFANLRSDTHVWPNILGTLSEKMVVQDPAMASEGYIGYYPDAALEIIGKQIDLAQYGQLMLYDKYEVGEIYIFDKWKNETGAFTVFLARENGDLLEFKIDRIGIMEPSGCFISDSTIFVHTMAENSLVVIEINIETAKQTMHEVTFDELGVQRTHIERDDFFYDAEEGKLIAIAFDGVDNKKIIQYGFAARSAKTVNTPMPVSEVFKVDGGYLLVNHRLTEVITMYVVDDNFEELEVRDIAMPKVPKSSIAMDRSYNRLKTKYFNGTLYGIFAHYDEQVYYYYTVDLALGTVTSLARINTMPYPILEYNLFDPNTGCSPIGNIQ